MLKIVAGGGYSIGDRAGNCKKKAPAAYRKADTLRRLLCRGRTCAARGVMGDMRLREGRRAGHARPYGAAHVWVKVLKFLCLLSFQMKVRSQVRIPHQLFIYTRRCRGPRAAPRRQGSGRGAYRRRRTPSGRSGVLHIGTVPRFVRSTPNASAT